MKIESKKDKAILTPGEIVQILRKHIEQESGRKIAGDIHLTQQNGLVPGLSGSSHGFNAICELEDSAAVAAAKILPTVIG